MKKIILTPAEISILVQKFNVRGSFVKDALELTKLPELDAESQATTIREAEEEYIEAEGCCFDDEKAAFRRWIELAETEEEVMRAFERITCEESDAERMLAIRKVVQLTMEVTV